MYSTVLYNTISMIQYTVSGRHKPPGEIVIRPQISVFTVLVSLRVCHNVIIGKLVSNLCLLYKYRQLGVWVICVFNAELSTLISEDCIL